MTENEMKFLTELHDLMRSYSIDTVIIKGSPTSKDPQRIAFYSNDRELSFIGYSDGNFLSILSETPKFAPYLDDDKMVVACIYCKHLKEVTPRGNKIKDCGWCEMRNREVSYSAKCVCKYFDDTREE